MLAFDLDIGIGNTLAGRVLVPSSLLRTLAAQAAGPSADDIDDGYTQTCPRLNLTSSLSQATANVTVWYKDDTHWWILDSRQDMEGVAITGYPMAGGAAGGGTGTDTNDYVDDFTASVSGQTLAITPRADGDARDLTAVRHDSHGEQWVLAGADPGCDGVVPQLREQHHRHLRRPE